MDFDIKEGRCPVCDCETEWSFDCPGYGKGKQIMVCNPPSGCGNAIRYDCLNYSECNWWYRIPNNRSSEVWDISTRTYIHMGVKPSWLEE